MKIKKIQKLFGKKYAVKGESEAGKLSDVWNTMLEHIATTAGMNAPSKNNGLAEFLLDTRGVSSPRMNLNRTADGLVQRDGKKHYVVRTFMQRQADQLVNGTDEVCTTGNEIAYNEDKVYIRYRSISDKFTINNEYLRCIREGKEVYQQDVMSQFLRMHIDKFKREIATLVATGKNHDGQNYVGVFARNGGTTCKALPLYNSAGTSPNQAGDIQLQEDMLQADINNMPTLVGGTILTSYQTIRNIASANLNGFDVTKLGQELVIYRDVNMSTLPIGGVVHDKHILAIVPGALRLVTSTDNEGDFAYETPTQLRGTIQDPYLGLLHDYYIHVADCGNEVKTTIHFAINYDVIGYPSCWADPDPNFKGVTDVFCYTVECSDASACGIVAAQGVQINPENGKAPCNGYQECTVACAADFQSQCDQYNRFYAETLTSGTITAVRVNGMDIALGGNFDLSTEAGANALAVALQAALSPFANIKSVSGGWNTGGSNAEYNVMTTLGVTSVVLVNNAGADIDMVKETGYYQNVKNTSVASNGATIATLNWTAPDATSFAGAPTESLIGVAGHYGTMQNFFAELAETGTYELVMVDSLGCESTKSKELAPCAGLEFDVTITAFEDTNDDDTQDVGELALQNIKLKVWKGITQTVLVDEIVTNVSGEATFQLEAGIYNLTIDAAYGAAIGRTIATTTPKYFEVDAAGNVTYGVNWTENGLVPISPAVA